MTESHLRRIVRSQISLLCEEGETPAKAGAATSADSKGTLDIKKIAETLKVDGAKLKTAVSNLRTGKRTPADNQIFGDVFAQLLNASPDDTVKVMNALKKVQSAKGVE